MSGDSVSADDVPPAAASRRVVTVVTPTAFPDARASRRDDPEPARRPCPERESLVGVLKPEPETPRARGPVRGARLRQNGRPMGGNTGRADREGARARRGRARRTGDRRQMQGTHHHARADHRVAADPQRPAPRTRRRARVHRAAHPPEDIPPDRPR